MCNMFHLPLLWMQCLWPSSVFTSRKLLHTLAWTLARSKSNGLLMEKFMCNFKRVSGAVTSSWSSPPAPLSTKTSWSSSSWLMHVDGHQHGLLLLSFHTLGMRELTERYLWYDFIDLFVWLSTYRLRTENSDSFQLDLFYVYDACEYHKQNGYNVEEVFLKSIIYV